MIILAKLDRSFYQRSCLEVARDLVGKLLVFRTAQGDLRLRISETEAYGGETDTACHVSKGRTPRTEVFYAAPGTLYIYLCYGMHWMLNIVTGDVGDPQAVLIRACIQAPGPGRLTRKLGITGNLNRSSVLGDTLWIEDDGFHCPIRADKRVGIGFAAPEDQDKPWRFILSKTSP